MTRATTGWPTSPPKPGGADAGPARRISCCFPALGACTAITLQMYAARKQWPLSGIEVELRLNPTGTPAPAATTLHGRIPPCRVNLTDEQRERLLQIANFVPDPQGAHRRGTHRHDAASEPVTPGADQRSWLSLLPRRL